DYESDCGSYTYSLRHVEFPQTDENRTYYTLDVQFNREITFSNFKRDFSLFYADGRFINFNKLGYLDAENNAASVDANPITDSTTPLAITVPTGASITQLNAPTPILQKYSAVTLLWLSRIVKS
ncbi:MAG: hypothetical protein IKL41_00110, partial [Clostridia bacterium]|nr:hypothetical protein [Clostridia bacterium]